MEFKEVTIIGAGPAGLAAAIQLQRYGLEPLVLEKAQPGGLLLNANLVENYPGFPDGIPGPELAQLFIEQAAKTSIQIIHAEALEISYRDQMYIIRTCQDNYTSPYLVVASGTKPKESPIKPSREIENRIYSEVYPLLEIKGKRIVITGAGDAAFDYALNLSKNNHVTILNRSRRVKCLPLLWERAMFSTRITYRQDASIIAIQGGSRGIILECKLPDGVEHIDADYLICAFGRQAQLDFVPPKLIEIAGDLEDQGTLFLIGDVKNGLFRQTSIAVGDGVMAAMKIYQHLREAQRK
jgi:thioredoxin reductase (NADPH)